MKLIMHTMMMQSTKTAELMAQLRMTHLEVENQLQLLRAKIQHHEEAWRAERSNGAAARTVATLDKATLTNRLPEMTVLKAVAVIDEVHDKHKPDEKNRTPVDVKTGEQKKPKHEDRKRTQV